MSAPSTVVFADLTGSTRIFEVMGNASATEMVTPLIQWIGHACTSHGGRVVKTMGDGLFAIFRNASAAVPAMIELQRVHQQRLLSRPLPLRMDLQIGIACGEVVEVDGDCYGDAVNLASRLSDLAGPGQIWATDAVIAQLRERGVEILHRNLGPINIRGKNEMPVVHRIDWQDEILGALTVPAALMAPRGADSALGRIALSWLDVRRVFGIGDLPIHLGRDAQANFVVNDPRVSRLHARIEARQGGCVLVDLSTYGTWVRFQGSSAEIALRRDECALHGNGEVGLGAPLSDFSAPTIAFDTTS